MSPALTGVPEVAARGQGGLLDVAVPPDFATTREVWLTYAKPVEGGTVTAVARGVLRADGTGLDGVTDVFLQSPVADSDGHYGSRIVFDGTHVFVTLGERQGYAERAQDMAATYGKVVRLNRDGTVPGDNPMGGPVWTMGHRNPQGAALDAEGTLWTVEHGPKGGDELNLASGGRTLAGRWSAMARPIAGGPSARAFRAPRGLSSRSITGTRSSPRGDDVLPGRGL